MNGLGLRVICWNVNSINNRHGLLKKMISEQTPDVLFLQETRTLWLPELQREVAEDFHVLSQVPCKGRNGVSTLVSRRFERAEVVDALPAELQRYQDQGRFHLVCAFLGGVTFYMANCYVHQGSSYKDGKQHTVVTRPDFIDHAYVEKLNFLRAMSSWAEESRGEGVLFLGGDFNVVFKPSDSWHDEVGIDKSREVSWTPAERELLGGIDRVLGEPSYRLTGGERHNFSWYDYRQTRREGVVEWSKGIRVDYLFTNVPDTCSRFRVLRAYREETSGSVPSDHVPLAYDFRLANE